jgi:hypothetical protein
MSKQKYAVYVGFVTDVVAETEADAISNAAFGLKYGVDNYRKTSVQVHGVVPYEEQQPEPTPEVIVGPLAEAPDPNDIPF